MQERLLKKLLTQKNEEEIKTYKAKQHWAFIKKKIKVIRMMQTIGGEMILEMNENSKKKNAELEDNDQTGQNKQSSRFISSPNNYWNMQWNNCTQIIFVIYIFLGPMLIV